MSITILNFHSKKYNIWSTRSQFKICCAYDTITKVGFSHVFVFEAGQIKILIWIQPTFGLESCHFKSMRQILTRFLNSLNKFLTNFANLEWFFHNMNRFRHVKSDRQAVRMPDVSFMILPAFSSQKFTRQYFIQEGRRHTNILFAWNPCMFYISYL